MSDISLPAEEKKKPNKAKFDFERAVDDAKDIGQALLMPAVMLGTLALAIVFK